MLAPGLHQFCEALLRGWGQELSPSVWVQAAPGSPGPARLWRGLCPPGLVEMFGVTQFSFLEGGGRFGCFIFLPITQYLGAFSILVLLLFPKKVKETARWVSSVKSAWCKVESTTLKRVRLFCSEGVPYAFSVVVMGGGGILWLDWERIKIPTNLLPLRMCATPLYSLSCFHLVILEFLFQHGCWKWWWKNLVE